MTPFHSLPDMSGKNPFVAIDPGEVPANAPEGSYTYALVPSAPGVPAAECEVGAASVEIAVRWGETTLHVAHLTPPRSFHVGEGSDGAAVDFLLPASPLGLSRLPLVRKAADGSVRAVIPAGAKGTATIAGQVVKLSDLMAGNHAEASPEVPFAIELPLRASTAVRFELGGIGFEIASVNAGRKVSGRFSFDRRGLPFQAMSTVLHLGLLGAAAVFMPPMAMASEDSMSRDQIDSLKTILSANAEREIEAPKQVSPDDARGNRDSNPGRSSSNEANGRSANGSGATGKRGAPGPRSDSANVPLSREDTLAMARGFGMIDLLKPSPGAAPSATWSNLPALTGVPSGAGMWDGGTAESGGGGVLALTGIGEGGDSDGRGIALDRVGTSGPTAGLDKFGRRSRPGGDRPPSGPSMRPSDPTIGSRLPAELIQRVVRQNFGRFRYCYENGLRNNPSLAGRVSVRFVIGRDGGVMSAANGGSDLPDASVVSCVVQSFRGLQFPQAEEGGAATVVYPITFAPAK